MVIFNKFYLVHSEFVPNTVGKYSGIYLTAFLRHAGKYSDFLKDYYIENDKIRNWLSNILPIKSNQP